MTQEERWQMYLEIQQLKQLGLNKSQVERNLGISRTTVTKYWDLTPEEVNQLVESLNTRRKKLDAFKNEILSWLNKFPDLSAAQVLDWLQERYTDIGVCESTVRNYVRQLRKEFEIPKVRYKRQYEAIEDPPMGQQMQVDFGEKQLLDANGNYVKLWLIAFVLSHSRQKYVEWLDRPFTTKDVINMHENAFEYYGGMTREVVYDQDHLILVSENHGDLILTNEFAAYLARRGFKIHMCRKQDPESKGRVEKTVDFVKSNFAHNRLFHNLEKLNEETLAWLQRTGNGKKHNTTKKIPAQVFLEEKQHLQPVKTKITLAFNNPSITRMVRKDNTIMYKGNRYSVPLGTYDGTDRKVDIKVTEKDNLIIMSNETGEVIAEHRVCHETGKLIKNTNHTRDRLRGLDAFSNEVIDLLGSLQEARTFIDAIRVAKPRYIRDQLQLIRQQIKDVDPKVVGRAINYCLKNRLYSASDFVCALEYFQCQPSTQKIENPLESEVKPLDELDMSQRKSKVETRDFEVYQKILDGEM